jgi:hypothetical protein
LNFGGKAGGAADLNFGGKARGADAGGGKGGSHAGIELALNSTDEEGEEKGEEEGKQEGEGEEGDGERKVLACQPGQCQQRQPAPLLQQAAQQAQGQQQAAQQVLGQHCAMEPQQQQQQQQQQPAATHADLGSVPPGVRNVPSAPSTPAPPAGAGLHAEAPRASGAAAAAAAAIELPPRAAGAPKLSTRLMQKFRGVFGGKPKAAKQAETTRGGTGGAVAGQFISKTSRPTRDTPPSGDADGTDAYL